MAAAIVLLPSLTVTSFQLDSPATRGAVLPHIPSQRPPLEQQVAYWHSKAVKRLRGWDRANRRTVSLRLAVKRLRASRSNPSGSPAALSVPHYSDWLCIHSHEGSWTDAGDPYWGGLQMDRGFMEAYAPRWLLAKGWANAWTPREQMWVAERAWRVRGFEPWPNTAAMCGLL